MNEQDEVFLTTIDNPYNPFTQFDEWYSFDEGHGYHTCGYIDRVAMTSSEMSEADQNAMIDAAIDEILQFNITGLYRKVTRNTFNRTA